MLRQPLFKQATTPGCDDDRPYIIAGYMEEQSKYGITRSVIMKPADGSPGGFYQNLYFFNELKTDGWLGQ